ncbi:hypothetical protein AVEN_208163-1 [Araneus ventricosus]|uniref:Uncharacterized protein n=1 Tax=Araneus ventricosus TaxID=182803 RepID=A0A4Y2QIQ8_ARAVE|nr:hypothetical protein AVEN_208163-1 [Araneus ventricosus]
MLSVLDAVFKVFYECFSEMFYMRNCIFLVKFYYNPAGVVSHKLSRKLISQNFSYSVSVSCTLARIKILNLLYSQNTSFSRTRESNKTNGNKIIRAGSEFAKREKKEPKGKKRRQAGVIKHKPFVMKPLNIMHKDCFQYA